MGLVVKSRKPKSHRNGNQRLSRISTRVGIKWRKRSVVVLCLALRFHFSMASRKRDFPEADQEVAVSPPNKTNQSPSSPPSPSISPPRVVLNPADCDLGIQFPILLLHSHSKPSFNCNFSKFS